MGNCLVFCYNYIIINLFSKLKLKCFSLLGRNGKMLTLKLFLISLELVFG